MTFEYGDVIFADHLVYKHFGIYAGKNSSGEDIIIHFATPKGEKMFNMSKAIVHETTMSYFSQGCSVHKYDFSHFTEYSWQDFLSDVFKKKTQTSHTENIPYALINQLELNVESHSRTLLCTQTTHPKSGQIVQESFQERFDQQDF